MEGFDIWDRCYCYSLSKGAREVFRSTAVIADCNQFIVIQHLQFRVCWNPVGFVAIVYCFVLNNCNYTPWRSFIVTGTVLYWNITNFTDYYQYQTQNQQIWIIENRFTSKKIPYYLLKFLIYASYPQMTNGTVLDMSKLMCCCVKVLPEAGPVAGESARDQWALHPGCASVLCRSYRPRPQLVQGLACLGLHELWDCALLQAPTATAGWCSQDWACT